MVVDLGLFLGVSCLQYIGNSGAGLRVLPKCHPENSPANEQAHTGSDSFTPSSLQLTSHPLPEKTRPHQDRGKAEVRTQGETHHRAASLGSCSGRPTSVPPFHNQEVKTQAKPKGQELHLRCSSVDRRPGRTEEGRLAKRAARHGQKGPASSHMGLVLEAHNYKEVENHRLFKFLRSASSQPLLTPLARTHFVLPMPCNGQVADL